MKKLPILVLLMTLFAGAMISCEEESEVWNNYKEWYEKNEAWVKEQTNMLDDQGNKYYTKVVASFDDQAEVYIHYFNDRSLTANNLRPLISSTVDVKYIGKLYDGTPFDSSFVSVSPADSLFRTKVTGVIDGWKIALMDMHVGDSARVLIPYLQAYGASSAGSIPPYSALQFDIKLVDIYKYEK